MDFETPEKKEYYKTARWGVISFCAIHLILEVLMGPSPAASSSVIINFFISAWILESRINKGKMTSNFFMNGFLVALGIFMIRVALGFVVSSVLMS